VGVMRDTKDGEGVLTVVEPPAALVRAVRRILRPLVRGLIAHGFTYTYLAQILKEVFLETAEKDFRAAGERPTDSCINLLTGINRKEIRRLRAEVPAKEPRPSLSLNAKLVQRWMTDRDYQDDSGEPRPLPRRGHNGVGPDFDDLVEGVSKDIRPRAVIDEWVRFGIAVPDADGRLHLNRDVLGPGEGFEGMADYFGTNLHDHLAVSIHNLLRKRPPMLEHAVQYPQAATPAVATLGTVAQRVGMLALLAFEQEAMKDQMHEATGYGATSRINFGIYFHAEPSQEEGLEFFDDAPQSHAGVVAGNRGHG